MKCRRACECNGVFFFKVTSTTKIYPLSLQAALPISLWDLIDREWGGGGRGGEVGGCGCVFERLRCHVEFVESSQPVREVMAGHCWTPVDGQKQE